MGERGFKFDSLVLNTFTDVEKDWGGNRFHLQACGVSVFVIMDNERALTFPPLFNAKVEEYKSVFPGFITFRNAHFEY